MNPCSDPNPSTFCILQLLYLLEDLQTHAEADYTKASRCSYHDDYQLGLHYGRAAGLGVAIDCLQKLLNRE